MVPRSPFIRNMIACEDIVYDPESPSQVSLIRLVNVVNARASLTFPIVQDELCVFVQMTGCRGSGIMNFRVAHADSDHTAYESRNWTARLPADPIEIVGLPIRVRKIIFRESGLYWLQLMWYDHVIHQFPLLGFVGKRLFESSLGYGLLTVAGSGDPATTHFMVFRQSLVR